MRKIAPRLHEAVSHVIAGPLRDDAERELRALLAVARAAKRVVGPNGNVLAADQALETAVARLARLARRGTKP